MTKKHTFHIPVMGIGFTIDTPLKVSHYGIDSVISLVDDILLEKLRKMYSEKFNLPYKEITDKVEDFRAKRITSYLNMINDQAKKKFAEFKTATLEKRSEIIKYFDILPDSSSIKQEFKKLTAEYFDYHKVSEWLKDNLHMGSIDVNIMTKVDKENYKNGEKLPNEFNDAFAALRGFAESDLESSVVLSAGMSPRLYGYIENFADFYPDKDGYIKKKIVLKVSDYRSALVQGKFFAKKGLWVSEYRIESGLNCGGHAFATDGFLMGPILAEFKNNRQNLIESVSEILVNALGEKDHIIPDNRLPIKVTAQGGVGTAEEHQFLLDHYEIDSVGWGTPFLLVPEATNVDEKTRNQLMGAKEKDLYLSDISPLGVPFNSLRGNTKDVEKQILIDKGRPGSSCPKEYLVSNKEYTEKSICTASRQYQNIKIKELATEDLSADEYQSKFNKITNKSCICVGLGTSSLLINNIETKKEGVGVSVCPGPNMAYFSKILSLKEMTSHIYGKTNVISRDDRPNMFVKELNIYIKYLNDRYDEAKASMTSKQEKYLIAFESNLRDGISYYNNLFMELNGRFEDTKAIILHELDASMQALNQLKEKIESKSLMLVMA